MTTTIHMKYRPIVKALILCLILSQVALPGRATATDIADLPMAVKNTVLPNVMFTLDDSGSMKFEVMPDSSDVYLMYPKVSPIYGNDYYSAGTFDSVPRFNSDNRYARYYRSSQYNKIYYNPAKRYVPWTNADGTLMANAVPTAAYHNPNIPGEGSRDLTTDFTSDGPWKNDDGTVTSESRTFYPATYFKYKGITPLTGPTDGNNLEANFDVVEIKSGNAPFAKATGRTDCADATCTYAEEIQNFANWYTYYRSRILTARAGIGKAFSLYDNNMRVGFGAINKGSASIDGTNTSTVISGVRNFTSSDRTAFYSSLYGHAIPSAGTPLRKAMDAVGQYFMRTDDRGPWGKTPGSSGGTQYACRQNYHILMTDGYWNGDEATTEGARANVDNTSGSTITRPAGASYTYAPGNPYSDGHANTLADVAMYYWVNDLRTGLDNIVPSNTKDPAFWQHMVNFTVGLGVTGSVSQANIDSAFTSSPASITWPNPASSDANKIDDLAHAAINSRGGFFSASDPTTFSNALSDALNDIIGRSGAAAAVAVANANPTTGDNASYSSRYDSGTWTGDLFAYPIDLTTGVPDESDPLWTTSAQAQLDNRTPSSRHIVTYSGSGGIQFQPSSAGTTTKLTAAQQDLLNTSGETDSAAVLAYLRGDKSKEGTVYRPRAHLLGDIVNAEAVIVRNPLVSYADAGFSTFKTNQASRTKVIFQGANDGMLHAFNAATGAEEWAYIPKLVFSNLNSLTKKVGFSHKYYVDSTPTVADVDFKQTDGASGSGQDWRTILVGGLGKGGRGYYALDVTNPVATSEADAANKVLWEFPRDGNRDTHIGNSSTPTYSQIMGYSFGRPIVVKTAAEGWVVLIPSGYNNGTDTGGTGDGYLIVLNARTGDVIKVIATSSSGTASNPSGLAHISAYVENADVDNTVDYVYGGDLLGNVWRFDLTAANTNSWSVTQLAALVDSTGAAQPVTTAPELGKIDIGNVTFKRMVYVGTGKYLGDSDVPGTDGASASATQTQTMYALVDNQTSSPLITPLRSNLQEQTFTTSDAGDTRTASSTAFSYAGESAKKGWYIDLPVSGERINTDPAIGIGVLTFVTNIPGSDPCVPGGSAWVNSVDYKTGGFVAGAGVTYSSTYLGNVLGSRAVLIKLESGRIKGLIRKSDASTQTTDIPGNSTSSLMRRISWRELADQ